MGDAARVQRVRTWAGASALVAWLLIVIGGLVSATGSGLGCGDDWPLCGGRVLPHPADPAMVLEYSHRAVAGLVAILTLMTAWRARSLPRLRGLAMAALGLVLLQSLLGAWTVVLGLSLAVSTVHLATAELYFAVLVATFAAAAVVGGPQQPLRDPPPGTGWGAEAPEGAGLARFRRLAAVTLALAYAVIVLGGYVKLSGAGLACGLTFPLCSGRILPDVQGPHGHLVLAHWLHRLGALALAGHVMALAARSRGLPGRPDLARLSSLAVALTALQIGLGVATVFTRLMPALSVLHLANGTVLLGVLTAAFVAARAVTERRAAGVPVAAAAVEGALP